MSMAPVEEQTMNTYSLTGPSSSIILSNALRILKPHLPICLALYRRLQFGRFFDATCLLTNVPLDSNAASPPQDSAWCMAFADRSCRPETEVWFYGSWEDEESATTPSSTDQPPTTTTNTAAENLMRNLLVELKRLNVPTSIHQDILDAQTRQTDTAVDHGGFSRKDYGGHASDPNIMLWGGVHARTVPILQRLGYLSYRFKTALVPNFTFMWDVDALRPARELPRGLRWGELRAEHFALVRSRTQIPRQDRTLAVLPNLGIFPVGGDEATATAPVSWAFVGLDASLTTLHVEPEYRGKGLAKAITTKLFKEKMEMFREEGVTKWAHGYVIVGNKESEGMCRSLGGKSGWESFWLRVDLAQV